MRKPDAESTPDWLTAHSLSEGDVYCAYGWPAVSVERITRFEALYWFDHGDELAASSRLAHFRIGSMFFPLEPRWTGLMINTAFYALGVLGVRAVWLAFWAWKRRGCCLACGYSRAGLPITSRCPECGTQP